MKLIQVVNLDDKSQSNSGIRSFIIIMILTIGGGILADVLIKFLPFDIPNLLMPIGVITGVLIGTYLGMCLQKTNMEKK